MEALQVGQWTCAEVRDLGRSFPVIGVSPPAKFLKA